MADMPHLLQYAVKYADIIITVVKYVLYVLTKVIVVENASPLSWNK